MTTENNIPLQVNGPVGAGYDFSIAGDETKHSHCTAKAVTLTVFESPDRLTKSFSVGEDGSIVKTAAAQMSEGKARRVAIDFEQLEAVLEAADERTAIGFGLHDSSVFGESVKLTIAQKADPSKRVIARTKEYFKYQDGLGIIMLDFDPSPDGVIVNQEELRRILAETFQGFSNAACWVRGSLSAGIYKTGEEPKAGRGFHLYFPVLCASDIPRFGRVLFRRLWLNNYGYVAISNAGSFLVRSLIDESVFAPERLDFVGRPVIGEGLEYSPPRVVFFPGGFLDTRALPDLDEAEEARFKAMVAQAKQTREDDRKAVRARWEERHTKAMVKRGIPAEQAKAQLERIAQDGNRFDLYCDFPLMFAQRGFASVGEVLANAASFDGEACADPLEGVDYGRTTAKFFANAREGKPVINSQAHGGMKYFLHADPEPAASRQEPRQEEPPFDMEYYEQLAPLNDGDGVLIDDHGPAVKQSSKRKAKPASRRGLAGGTLQDSAAVAGRAAAPSHPGNQSRAHAPAPNPTLPTHSTQDNDLNGFPENLNLHPAYTELHPSYTDRLNEYTRARGSLIKTDAKGNAKLVAESLAAEIVAKLIGNQFRYHAQAGVWHRFNLNHWAVVTEAETYPHITAILTCGTEGEGFRQAYLNGVATILKKADMLPLPPAQPGKIPFSNGLFDIATRTLEPLTRDNALTWAIPHPFTEGADCLRFKAWLVMALGDEPALIEFIRAFIAACLTGRADLQKFLMLLGPGGTGKGTFLRLLTEILGASNCTTTDLKNLEQNRFETAALYGKRLAAITDAGRYVGSIDTLKAVIGQDELRREEKHRQQGGTFRYEGMVLIASNEQLAATDYTSGLERRLLVVKFTRRFSPEEKTGFIKHQGEAALQAEIPAIIQWALGLSREDVTRQFMRPPKVVADWSLESLTEQNPVVEWITENLLHDPNAWTMIGTRGEKKDHGFITFMDSDIKLYPNYLHFCYQSKREALALARFRNTVLDMLETLKIRAQTKRRSQGMGILGVKLRPQVL